MATAGLGLGPVAAVFTLLNAFVFRADEVHNPHELFSVSRPRSANAEPERFTRSQYEALVRETSVFSDAVAMGPEIDRWIDGQRMEGSSRATSSTCSAPAQRVDARSHHQMTSRAAFTSSFSAIARWSRSFASDPGVVGRMVQVNEVPFEVVGVMPEGFRGLTVAPPDFWAPLVLLGEFHRNNEGRDHSVGIVGRLKPGVSRPGARGAPRVGLASDRLFFILTARACASGNSTRLRRDGA